jgi:hypothetical protein
MDELDDASVFVADPYHTGSGPEGMDVLAAARLTGAGKVNMAGFITVGDDEGGGGVGGGVGGGGQRKLHFTCVDQSIQGKISQSITGSSKVVGAIAQQVVRFSHGGPAAPAVRLQVPIHSFYYYNSAEPTYHPAPAVRLQDLAAYYGCLVSDRVVLLVARGGGGGQMELRRAAGERPVDFLQRVLLAAGGAQPTIEPAYAVAPTTTTVAAAAGGGKLAGKLVVFGGELDDPQVGRHLSTRYTTTIRLA